MTPSPSALGIRTCHLWMMLHIAANETSVTLLKFSQVSRRFMLTRRHSNMETLLASPHVPQGYIYIYIYIYEQTASSYANKLRH